MQSNIKEKLRKRLYHKINNNKMKGYIISGIQQMGIGVTNDEEALLLIVVRSRP